MQVKLTRVIELIRRPAAEKPSLQLQTKQEVHTQTVTLQGGGDIQESCGLMSTAVQSTAVESKMTERRETEMSINNNNGN